MILCMRQKLLTLIVPTYNMEKYLPMCLDSVTADEVPDTLEVIVVNDGSRDRSLEIMEQYQTKRPDIIRVIDKENGNYGSCINAGLAVATGKYCRLLDADDCFDTMSLVSLLKRMETCDVDLIVTLIVEDIYIGDNKVNEVKYPFNTIIKDYVYKAESFDICSHARNCEFRMHGLTYKTSVLKDSRIRFLEGVSYTDNLYIFIPFPWVKDLIVYDLYLYHYRIGREGQTMSSGVLQKSLADITSVLDFMFQKLEQVPQNNQLKANMIFLIMGALSLFLAILKRQNGICKEQYEIVGRIIRQIKKHRIRHYYLKRWYLKLWRKTESSRILDFALRVHHLVG